MPWDMIEAVLKASAYLSAFYLAWVATTAPVKVRRK